MTLKEAYTLYIALRLHFTTEAYNISKEQGRVRCDLNHLERKPRLKYFLQKYAKKYPVRHDFVQFLVANFVYGDKYGNVYDGNPEDAYSMLVARQDQLTYRFKSDINTIKSLGFTTIESIWSADTGKKPPILSLFYNNTLALETLVILNKLFDYVTQVDERYTIDPVWKELSMTIRKYSPFVKTDKDKFRELVNVLLP